MSACALSREIAVSQAVEVPEPALRIVDAAHAFSLFESFERDLLYEILRVGLVLQVGSGALKHLRTERFRTEAGGNLWVCHV